MIVSEPSTGCVADKRSPVRHGGSLLRKTFLFGAVLVGCGYSDPSNGDKAEVTHILEDERYEWTTIKTANTRIHFPVGSFADTKREILPRRAEDSRNAVLTRLREEDYSSVLDLFYVDSRSDMEALTGTPVTGYAYFDAGAVVLVFNETWRAFERHELTHVVTLGTWPGPAGDAISEGLATYVDGRCGGYDNGRVTRTILDTQNLIPLDALVADFRGWEDLAAYLQAASVIDFTVRQLGSEVIRTLWDRGLQAVPELLEIPPPDYESTFQEWLSTTYDPIPPAAWNAIRLAGCGTTARW